MPASLLFLRSGAASLVLLSLFLARSHALSPYTQKFAYSGADFFNEFDFIIGPDPDKGYANYVSKVTGLQGRYVLPATSPQSYNQFSFNREASTNSTVGRDSIRIQSKQSFTHGLLIADIITMPFGCGTWPKYGTMGSTSNDGAINIIQGINSQTNNIYSVETKGSCSVNPTSSDESGQLLNSACNATGGCSIQDAYSKSYGAGLSNSAPGNSGGPGGYYATEWTKDKVQMWFFPHDGSLGPPPSDINMSSPDPTSWGMPHALFQPSSCTLDDELKNHKIVFDTSFCGVNGAAGVNDDTWKADSTCSTKANTCQDYVMNVGAAYKRLIWQVASLKLFQVPVASPSSSVAVSSSTSAAVSNSTAQSSAAQISAPFSNSSATASDASFISQPTAIQTSTIISNFSVSLSSMVQSTAIRSSTTQTAQVASNSTILSSPSIQISAPVTSVSVNSSGVQPSPTAQSTDSIGHSSRLSSSTIASQSENAAQSSSSPSNSSSQSTTMPPGFPSSGTAQSSGIISASTATSSLQASSNVSPSNTTKLSSVTSAASTQLPAASTQLPGASTQLPGTSTQLPGTSTQLPGASTQLPEAQSSASLSGGSGLGSRSSTVQSSNTVPTPAPSNIGSGGSAIPSQPSSKTLVTSASAPASGVLVTPSTLPSDFATSAGVYREIGCYGDPNSNGGPLFSPSEITFTRNSTAATSVHACLTACGTGNYIYAGYELGFCFCSNEINAAPQVPCGIGFSRKRQNAQTVVVYALVVPVSSSTASEPASAPAPTSSADLSESLTHSSVVSTSSLGSIPGSSSTFGTPLISGQSTNINSNFDPSTLASSTVSTSNTLISSSVGSGSKSPTSSSPIESSSSVPMTTSTVYATTEYTITSCAATVTDCPARMGQLTTETIALYTTVCPVAEPTPTPSPANIISTIYTTKIYTITSCPPSVTNCPARIGLTTTEIIPISTVTYPIKAAYTTVIYATYIDVCPTGLTTVTTTTTLTLPSTPAHPVTIPMVTTEKVVTLSDQTVTVTCTIPAPDSSEQAGLPVPKATKIVSFLPGSLPAGGSESSGTSGMGSGSILGSGPGSGSSPGNLTRLPAIQSTTTGSTSPVYTGGTSTSKGMNLVTIGALTLAGLFIAL
ncbi:hypothetical protein BP6252_02407 [Coleophoma cylindrospora]|uniref:GH16 domain-containing protein n=1 Tax=Coleophoma cylindrospora TaxID=1849047 RepID=A0A3D8SEN9_9HELO|nr:hypothetical protein BP6252_02407 [Coleophoma cylindrospora]